jgi:ribosomal protein S18 acetylase RimI-like enzyme
LIPVAYRGHVDSEINDQYRSPAGARRFLANIIQYPGCGTFFQPASFMALDNTTGRLCGMCLSSLVSFDVGHITQICVTPTIKGKGCGYELMRRSLGALMEAGCRAASLTVTAANTEAIALYERLGFRKVKEFSACVWEGF